MEIALFGGSFNPVHIGHYKILASVIENHDFHKIIVIPAYRNPLKNSVPEVPVSVRLKMLKATFAEFSNVQISEYELEKKQTSYSFKTLAFFQKQYPSHFFYMIVGEDAFTSFHLWANADKILESCRLIVFRRPGLSSPEKTDDPRSQSDKIIWIDTNIPDVSSTRIRQAELGTVEQNHWLHKKALPIWQEYKKNSAELS